MLNVRRHAQPPDEACPASAEGAAHAPRGRLNLLLSYAGWRDESWADRLPRLLEPMGIASLRADTGRHASQVIARHPIHMAVVDLGLPLDHTDERTEEAGTRLLELLRRLDQPPPTVVVKRGRSHRDDSREINAALRAGAFAVIDRPNSQPDLERLLEVLRRCLTRHYQGRWPGGAA
jgi:CheY-like chemotaxis protein